MAWVKFAENFDWKPVKTSSQMIAYKSGNVYNVPRACRDEAVARGVAKNTKSPKAGRRRAGRS